MRSPDEKTIEWMDQRIEPYLDGELPPTEVKRFEKIVSSSETWQNEVRLARRIRSELQELRQPKCPPSVTRKVLERTQRPGFWQRLRSRLSLPKQLTGQPALAGGLVLLLIGFGMFVTRPDPAPPDRYSQAQIAQAQAEAKWAIAYLAHIGEQTGRTLHREVLSNRMIEPMQRTVNLLYNHESDPQP